MMTRSIMRTRTGMIAGMLAAAALAVAAYAGDAPADDPAAMAQNYDKQAAELRAKAEKHESMAKAHRGGAGSQKMNHESVARHCDKIAANLRSAADESAALAAELRAGAKK
jgi:hypothetical protein